MSVERTSPILGEGSQPHLDADVDPLFEDSTRVRCDELKSFIYFVLQKQTNSFFHVGVVGGGAIASVSCVVKRGTT